MEQVFIPLTVYANGATGKTGLQSAQVRNIPANAIVDVEPLSNNEGSKVTLNIQGAEKTILVYETPSQVVAASEKFSATPQFPLHITLGADAAGGAQGAGYDVVSYFTEIDAATATTNDAVDLPAATKGKVHVIQNSTSLALEVYPASGQTINGAAANAVYAHAARTTVHYYCKEAGKWEVAISA